MRNILTLLFVVTISTIATQAQNFEYDSKDNIGNGLYKVSSGGYYGIIDANDNVLVSIEYQDIIFTEGKALLLKDDILYGIVDSLGVSKTFSGLYKVHPQYRYIHNGYIPVKFADELTYNGKWGYVDENEKPLKTIQRIKGAKTARFYSMTLFDDVTPFVEGYAAVFIKSKGWKHIDTMGLERYKLNDIYANAIFRSSIYNRECVIATEAGIRLYQENKNHIAVVKRTLSDSVTIEKVTTQNANNQVVFDKGVITLDSLRRATKYETNGKTITLIQEKTPKKENRLQETIDIKNDISVKLVYGIIDAAHDGNAYTQVKITNKSSNAYKNLFVEITCGGTNTKTAKDIALLEASSSAKIPIAIPARFSSVSIKRDVIVKIVYKDDSTEVTLPITINRYKPTQSR